MKTLTVLLLLSVTVACSGPKNFNLNDNTDMASAGDNGSQGTLPTPMPTTTPSPTPVVSPTPSAEVDLKDLTPLWEARMADGKKWSDYVESKLDTLGTDLLDVIPADKTLFCPKYANLSYAQRKQYWTFMMSAMAKFESSFNTNATYTESFADSSGNKVVSRGLLQISIESGNGYGCGLKTAQDLHDPLINLACGIRILNRWVARDARIAGQVDGTWRGGARYWAVLRAGNKTSYQSILKWSQNLSICK